MTKCIDKGGVIDVVDFTKSIDKFPHGTLFNMDLILAWFPSQKGSFCDGNFVTNKLSTVPEDQQVSSRQWWVFS